MSTAPTDHVISFGPYQLDRASGRLLRSGAAVPLRPKTFAVLEYLATHPGRLVPGDELLDAAWPDTHVTPSVLAGCIRELRRALGDDARAAQFIETAHGRGYRFVAALVVTAGAVEAAPLASAPRVPMLGRDSELAELARWFAQAIAGVLEREARERDPDWSAGHRAARPPGSARNRDRQKHGGGRLS